MWRAHLSLHASGGAIPPSWLEERGMFVCGSCCQIVSDSHASSHQSRCSGNCAPQNAIGHVLEATSVQHDATALPSLEDIFALKYQHFVTFPLMLYLHSLVPYQQHCAVLYMRTPLRHGSSYYCCLNIVYDRPNGEADIISLSTSPCSVTSGPGVNSVYCARLTQCHSKLASSTKSIDRSLHPWLEYAISLAREGLYSKACQILTSSGLAPNTPETWQLLEQKHPKGTPPIQPNSSVTSIVCLLTLTSYHCLGHFLNSLLLVSLVCGFNTF